MRYFAILVFWLLASCQVYCQKYPRGREEIKEQVKQSEVTEQQRDIRQSRNSIPSGTPWVIKEPKILHHPDSGTPEWVEWGLSSYAYIQESVNRWTGTVIRASHDSKLTGLCRMVAPGNTTSHPLQLFSLPNIPDYGTFTGTPVGEQLSVTTSGVSAETFACASYATPYTVTGGNWYVIGSFENPTDKRFPCNGITPPGEYWEMPESFITLITDDSLAKLYVAATSNSSNANSNGNQTFTVNAGLRYCAVTTYLAAPPLYIHPDLSEGGDLVPNGARTKSYNYVFTASGGSGGTKTWTRTSGTLPTGLSLASNGTLSGTPSAGGQFTYTLQVSDGTSTVSRSYTQTIFEPAATDLDENRYCTPGGEWIGPRFDGPAELPRHCVNTDLAYTPSPGPIVPLASGNVRTAIQNAACGSRIQLTPGATYSLPGYGTFIKHCDDAHWITIETVPTNLPPPGQRVTPCWGGVASLPARPSFPCPAGGAQNILAKIVRNSQDPWEFSDVDHVRFIGIEFTRGTNEQQNYYDNLYLDWGNKVIFDRCWMHGIDITSPNARYVSQHGAMTIYDVNQVAIIDSYFNDYWNSNDSAFSQPIAVTAGIGGGFHTYWGTAKFVNNFFEASGHDFFFGGGSGRGGWYDIEVRRNMLFKPMTWNKKHPSYNVPSAGFDIYRPAVQSIFESKNGGRVLWEGNIGRNVWGGMSQSAHCLELNANPQGSNFGAMAVDWTIRYSTCSYSGDILMLARYPDADQERRISYHDNVGDHLHYPQCDDCRNYPFYIWNPQIWIKNSHLDPLDKIANMVWTHTTILPDPGAGSTGTIYVFNEPLDNWTWKNMVYNPGVYGMGGAAGCGSSGTSIVIVNCGKTNFRYGSNLLYGSNTNQGTQGGVVANRTATNVNTVGFTDINIGNYKLTPSSVGHLAGDDGKDMGADIDLVNTYTNNVEPGLPPGVTPPVQISVTVSPSTLTLASGVGQQFSATVHNSPNQSVTWTTSHGSVPGGLFSGTTGPQTVTITATSVADPSASGTATVTVNAPIQISISIAPTSAPVQVSHTQQFTGTVTGTSNTALNWLVNGAVGGGSSRGTISTTGLYTAPASLPTPNPVTVTAQSVADITVTADAAVTITSAPPPPVEPWSGIIDSGRAIDWREAGIPAHGRYGRGIPRYTEVCHTIQPSGAKRWTPRTEYRVGDKVTALNGNLQTVTVAGVSGDTEPTWATTNNGEISEHTIRWRMNTRPASAGADAVEINYWIQQCGNQGKVVKLAEGTFYIGNTAGISFGGASGDVYSTAVDRTVLRGSGPDKTILKFYGTRSCDGNYGYVCMITNRFSTATVYSRGEKWIDGYAKGTSTITLEHDATSIGLSATDGAVGNLIFLDQRNDLVGICPVSGGTGNCSGVPGISISGQKVTVHTTVPHGRAIGDCIGIGRVQASQGPSDFYISDNNSGSRCGGQTGWFAVTAVTSPTSFEYTSLTTNTGIAESGSGYVALETGGIFNAAIYGAVTTEAGGIGRKCPDTNVNNNACQIGEISARDVFEAHKVVAINGNHITIDPPVLHAEFRESQSPGIWWFTMRSLLDDGVEDLTIDALEYTSTLSGSSFFYIKSAQRCWVRNVRGIGGTRNFIWDKFGMRNEFRENYYYMTKQGTSTSYGFEPSQGTTLSIYENNICQHLIACLIGGGASASIYGYNFTTDGAYGSAETMLSTLNGNHQFATLILIEGNNGNKVMNDHVHGTASLITLFRNRLRGQDTPAKLDSVRAVQSQWGTRGNNVIANVLGSENYLGTTTPYLKAVRYAMFGSGQESGMYDMGRTGTNSNNSIDLISLQSELLWGNYDVVTKATRFCGNSSNTGWATTCYGVRSANFVSGSGGTMTTSPGQRCSIRGNNGTGSVDMVGQLLKDSSSGILELNTPITITSHGTYSAGGAPTAGNQESSTVCNSSSVISTQLGSVSDVPSQSFFHLPAGSVPTVGDTQKGDPPFPASFYLTAKPTWWRTTWGEPSWPAIGPDVNATGTLNTTCTGSPTACDGIANHSYQIPAQICWNNSPIDNRYQKRFMITRGEWGSTLGGGYTGFRYYVNNTLRTQDTINVTGMIPDVYNGTYQITSRTANYVQVYAPVATTPGNGTPVNGTHGEMTWPNIKLYNADACYPDEARSWQRRITNRRPKSKSQLKPL